MHEYIHVCHVIEKFGVSIGPGISTAHEFVMVAATSTSQVSQSLWMVWCSALQPNDSSLKHASTLRQALRKQIVTK